MVEMARVHPWRKRWAHPRLLISDIYGYSQANLTSVLVCSCFLWARESSVISPNNPIGEFKVNPWRTQLPAIAVDIRTMCKCMARRACKVTRIKPIGDKVLTWHNIHYTQCGLYVNIARWALIYVKLTSYDSCQQNIKTYITSYKYFYLILISWLNLILNSFY